MRASRQRELPLSTPIQIALNAICAYSTDRDRHDCNSGEPRVTEAADLCRRAAAALNPDVNADSD